MLDPNLEPQKAWLLNIAGAPFWILFLLKPVLRGLQERPRAIPTLFFRLQEPPRALQEALKRLFDSFRVEDATGNEFWTRFGHVFGGPGA